MAPHFSLQHTSRGQSSCTSAGLSVSSEKVGPPEAAQGIDDIAVTLAVAHVAPSFGSSGGTDGTSGNWAKMSSRSGKTFSSPLTVLDNSPVSKSSD